MNVTNVNIKQHLDNPSKNISLQYMKNKRTMNVISVTSKQLIKIMHVDRRVELVTLDTFLTSLAPDDLASLSPQPVASDGLLTVAVHRLDGVLELPIMGHLARHHALTLPRLPAECLALITVGNWHWKIQF